MLFVLCSVNGRSCVVRSVFCQWKILCSSFCVLSMEDLVLFVLCSVNGRSCVVRSVNAATLILFTTVVNLLQSESEKKLNYKANSNSYFQQIVENSS